VLFRGDVDRPEEGHSSPIGAGQASALLAFRGPAATFALAIVGAWRAYDDGVVIEKAFSIEAAPPAIWDALWSDLGGGDLNAFSVEQSNWPVLLSVKVDLGGMQALITYRIVAKNSHSEVSATLEPLSRRYPLYQILTFGHFRTNYEMVLVAGLANLKQAVEGVSIGETDE
jgi:hypothetical protein